MIAALLLRWGIPQWLLKPLEIIICLALLVASYFAVYYHGKSVQYEADKTIVAKYKADVKTANDLRDVGLKSLASSQAVVVADLKEKLEISEARKQKTVTIIKQGVHHDVPPAVDKRSVDANVFTAGWVYTFNLAIADEVPGLSIGHPGDVDAATGIDASTVAEVAGVNNAECVARGKVILAWQEWYARSKTDYETFVKNAPAAVEIPSL